MGDIGTEQPEIEVMPVRNPVEAPADPGPALPTPPRREPTRQPERTPA